MAGKIKENDKKMNKNDKKTLKEEIISEEENRDANSEQSILEDGNGQTDNLQFDKIEQLKLKNDELQNRLLRVQADYDNFKKRTIKEKEELAKYAAAQLVESLLDAVDNFERAILASNESRNYDSLVQGVEMVYRQLGDVLAKEGLELIEAIGQPFNPEFHQAVMQVETDQYEAGYVVEELQKGYIFKGKVIRPSMVKVSA